MPFPTPIKNICLGFGEWGGLAVQMLTNSSGGESVNEIRVSGAFVPSALQRRPDCVVTQEQSGRGRLQAEAAPDLAPCDRQPAVAWSAPDFSPALKQPNQDLTETAGWLSVHWEPSSMVQSPSSHRPLQPTPHQSPMLSSHLLLCGSWKPRSIVNESSSTNNFTGCRVHFFSTTTSGHTAPLKLSQCHPGIPVL